MRKKTEVLECCLSCGRSFKEVKYVTKNTCQPCYRSITLWNTQFGKCRRCDKKVESYKDMKGGMCFTCLEERKSGKLHHRCIKCKMRLGRPSRLGVCTVCKDSYTQKIGQKKDKRCNGELSRLELEEVRKMINRWNNGLFSLLDHWRTVHYYIEICGDDGGPRIESQDPEIQVYTMLVWLKKHYVAVVNQKVSIY